MKFVIILLAICAFQTVLANFIAFLNNEHRNSLQTINAIVKKLYDNIQAAYEAAASRPDAVPEECWNDYKALVIQQRFRHKVADNCYSAAMAERERERQLELQHQYERQRERELHPERNPDLDRYRERQHERQREHERRESEKNAMGIASQCYANNNAAIVKDAQKRRSNTILCFYDHYNVHGPLRDGEIHPITRLTV